jgi:hypothetical protein
MRRMALAVTMVVFLAFAAVPLTAGVAAQAPSSTQPAPYSPGLGDFMTAYVQPHHIKLWFAGISGNWKLAAYEANELDETFDDVVSYQGNWHDLPISSLVQALIRPQLKSISAAIAAQDLTRFKSAYAGLNTACNRCHMSAQHEFVKIVTPASNPYFDQKVSAVQKP